MRAIVFEEFGEPAAVLRVADRPIPSPGPGEVLVRMSAAPINPSDLMNVRGMYARRPELPATPGFEGAGVVESAGPGMFGKFLVGRRVAPLNSRTGSWGEYAVVSARQAIPLSNRLPLDQAAMFFVNPATAYIMTRRILAVPRNEWLLQTAAGSALGRMIIRLGKRFGFRTLNIVRRQEQAAELMALGGDIVIAASARDLREKVQHATKGSGVRFAVDPVAGETGSAVVSCLSPGGRLLLYGSLSGQNLSISPRELIAAAPTIEGFWLGNWMNRQGLVGKLRLVRALTKLILEGVLASEVAVSFSLDSIGEAVTAAERVGRTGKILLKIDST